MANTFELPFNTWVTDQYCYFSLCTENLINTIAFCSIMDSQNNMVQLGIASEATQFISKECTAFKVKISKMKHFQEYSIWDNEKKRRGPFFFSLVFFSGSLF
jgi:hypothetical protein